MADLTEKQVASTTKVVGADALGNESNYLFVDQYGHIHVADSTLVIPENATAVEIMANGMLNAPQDEIYTITNGKTLTIQSLAAGGEHSRHGMVCELFEDPNGNQSVLNLIFSIFVNGNSSQFNINKTYVGNGIRKILTRMRKLGGGGYHEFFAMWKGFEL